MPIALPLRIRRHAEAFGVRDADGRPIAYVYFENEKSRGNATNRLSEAEAREIAQRIARALSATEGA